MHRPNRDHALHAASRILLGVAGVVLLALLVIRLPWIASTVGLGYNEGWNAYHAAAVRDGGNLYPDLESTGTVNNYPPTSFVLIGTLARIGGDPIRIGRGLSLLGLFLTLLGVFRIVRRSHPERREAAIVAVVIAALPFLTIWRSDYLGVNDPQMLAHGVMLTAAALLVGASGASRHVATAAVLMAVAGFIKHNLLPVPLAAVGALALGGDWRALRRFTLTGTAAAVGLVALAYLTWGDPFLDSLLRTPRTTRAERMVEVGLPLIAPLLPLVVISAAAAARVQVFARCYLGLAVAAAGIFLAGEGVRASGVLDIGIATGLVIGLWWATATTDRHRLLRVAVLAWVIGVGLQGVRTTRWTEKWDRIAPRAEREAAVIGKIQRAPEPVACHLIHLCFRAGVAWHWDPFNAAQAIKQGTPGGERLLQQFRSGEFGLVVMGLWPARSVEQMPPALRAAVAAGYAVVDSGSPVVMAPRATAKR